MSRGLPRPAPLRGIDLAGHRERALRALVLFFGSDFKASPAEWEARARGALVQMESYGVVPVWLYDPSFRDEAARELCRKLGRGEPVTADEVEAAGLPVGAFLLAQGIALIRDSKGFGTGPAIASLDGGGPGA